MKWNSAKLSLPNKDTEVIIYRKLPHKKEPEVSIGYYHQDTQEWVLTYGKRGFVYINTDDVEKVSYWSYIDPPPVHKNKNKNTDYDEFHNVLNDLLLGHFTEHGHCKIVVSSVIDDFLNSTAELMQDLSINNSEFISYITERLKTLYFKKEEDMYNFEPSILYDDKYKTMMNMR